MKTFATCLASLAVAFSFASVATLTGCSGGTEPDTSSAGSADTVQVDTGSVMLVGRQYGGLPVQSDVKMSVSYFLYRTSNGGSATEVLTAEDVGVRVSDPLANGNDQYRLYIRNSDTYGTTDTYSVEMVPQNGAYYAEEIGDPGAKLSDGTNAITVYRYDGSLGYEDQTLTQTFELDKLIGGNWVPLMDPISGNPFFTPQMYDKSKLTTY